MSNHGIIIIDWSKVASGSTIKDVISSLYGDNTDAIEGMAYYETEDETLTEEVQKLCEKSDSERDAAIMAELDYEREQAENEAMYEAEMQAQAEAEAEREAEMQAEWEGGY